MHEYSENFLNHYRRPRRVGDLESPSAVAIVHDRTCGDVVRVAVRTSDDGRRLAAVRVKAYGCAAAIAAASAIAELAEGRKCAAAARIDEATVADALGGLPPSRLHAAAVACQALRRALRGAARVTVRRP